MFLSWSMEEPESSCVILLKLDLDDVEEVVCEAYHRDGSAHAIEESF